MRQQLIDIPALKLEFCKWVETHPIAESHEPQDLEKYVYFRKGDGKFYKIEIETIPLKFKALVGK